MNQKAYEKEPTIIIGLLNGDKSSGLNITLDPNELIVGGMDTQDIYEIVSKVLVLNSINFTTTIQE